MARSRYVYVLLDNEDHQKLVAAFTVKWEMYYWVGKNPGDYAIYRVSDADRTKKPPELIHL